jgi:ABC-type multidrug transport system permease subunit
MHHPLFHLVMARLRELYREPGVLFWVFGFPLLLALCLGLAFRGQRGEPVPIGLDRLAPQSERVETLLAGDAAIRPVLLSQGELEQALRRGEVLAAISFDHGQPQIALDEMREGARLARELARRALQRGAGMVEPLGISERLLTLPGTRYIDFLLPGLLGVNLMSSSLWGVGWTIVQARSRKQLKRLAATPMRRSHYMLSQLVARAMLMVAEVAGLLCFGVLFFKFPLRGSLLGLLAVASSGAVCFTGIACLLASRTERNEVISGLMNVVMLPMYVLSGVFFARSRFPEFLQGVIEWLPLSLLNDALRGLLLEDQSLLSFLPKLGVLWLTGLACFALALRLFRWK